MRIAICGSMFFAKEMLEAKEELEQMGHIVEVPCDTQKFIDDSTFTTEDHETNFRHCIENDIVRKCFRTIEESDAILVLNYEKNGIEGYIGPSTLMEIGLAYHLRKKIMLLFAPPDIRKSKLSHEVSVMQPVILRGDMKKIAEVAA
jgi:hypothetical protein